MASLAALLNHFFQLVVHIHGANALLSFCSGEVPMENRVKTARKLSIRLEKASFSATLKQNLLNLVDQLVDKS